MFSFFLVFNHDLSHRLILPVSQLQTQQQMTSQIRLHKAFNINIVRFNILLKLMKNLASLTALI